MGAMKHYLNDVICACSDEQFGQDAIEYAVRKGLIDLTYDFETDVRIILSRYDEIADAYRRELVEQADRLVHS